jgi:hypothetical protein
MSLSSLVVAKDAPPSLSQLAYLGPAGTFTEQALLTQPDLAALDHVLASSISDVLRRVSTGEALLGFVAIENSIEGSVNITQDTLTFEADLLIQREVVIPVQLNLLVPSGTSLSDVQRVVSFPHAIAQCRGWLREHLPDADIGLAADAAVNAGFGSAGERCMAIAVVVAVGDIADPLVAAIAERMEGLVVGPGDQPSTDMGPLVTAEHREKVSGYVATGVEEGADVVVDGREIEYEGDGFFFGPTLIDRVTPGMTVYKDEIFGPVLSVVRVDTYEEGVKLIEDNRWGNGTAIFTRDGGAARQFVFDVDAGMVGVNVPIPVPVGYYSFGGWGESLFGDTHMYGPEGFRFWTRNKVVTSRWPDPSTSSVDLGFPRNG